jgi:cellobiose-specific phosphotransferase system component IIB
MTNFLMVEVESVTSNVPRSNFEEADLEIFAEMILETGGILKPLVLKKTGFERYEVVDGHFEYYAAVRAREKNPHKGEIVNAFIISSEKEEAVLNQVAVLKSVDYPAKIVISQPEKSDIIQLIEENKRIYIRINQLFSQVEFLNNKLDELVTSTNKNGEKQEPKINIDALFFQHLTEAVKNMIEQALSKPQHNMTKSQLLELAKQKGVKVTTRMTKSEITNALEKADKIQKN